MTVEFINIYLQYNIFVRIEKDFNLFFFFGSLIVKFFNTIMKKTSG